MTYKLNFYSDAYNELIQEYEINELLSIPESLATLPKSKDNDLFIVNTLKSTILPLLPRDLEDFKRVKLLELLKEIHDLSFNFIDSNNKITYSGSPLKVDNTSEEIILDSPPYSVKDLNLVELLKSKQSLEKELNTVNQELDIQLASAWEIINNKLAELNDIKTKWEKLSASQLDSDAINIIHSASLIN